MAQVQRSGPIQSAIWPIGSARQRGFPSIVLWDPLRSGYSTVTCLILAFAISVEDDDEEEMLCTVVTRFDTDFGSV